MAVHYLLRRGISGGSPLNPLRGLLPVSQELGRHPLSSAAAGDAVARLRGAWGREDVKQLLKATSCHPILAYVTQDDNLIGTLTVRETISYSARLRLPDNIPKEEKRALVEGTIIEMGLQDCADTVISNWHLRGISGGEKRRVSIALEILMRPRAALPG